MVFENTVRFLKPNFLSSGAGVRSNQFLEHTNRVGREALNSHFAAQPVVADHFHHGVFACLGSWYFEFNWLLGSLGFELGELGLVLSLLLLPLELDLFLERQLGAPLFLFVRVEHIILVPLIYFVLIALVTFALVGLRPRPRPLVMVPLALFIMPLVFVVFFVSVLSFTTAAVSPVTTVCISVRVSAVLFFLVVTMMSDVFGLHFLISQTFFLFLIN